VKTFIVFVCGIAIGAYLGQVLASAYAHAMMGQVGHITERSL